MGRNLNPITDRGKQKNNPFHGDGEEWDGENPKKEYNLYQCVVVLKLL